MDATSEQIHRVVAYEDLCRSSEAAICLSQSFRGFISPEAHLDREGWKCSENPSWHTATCTSTMAVTFSPNRPLPSDTGGSTAALTFALPAASGEGTGLGSCELWAWACFDELDFRCAWLHVTGTLSPLGVITALGGISYQVKCQLPGESSKRSQGGVCMPQLWGSLMGCCQSRCARPESKRKAQSGMFMHLQCGTCTAMAIPTTTLSGLVLPCK
jgi:hypothetical protein